ncbi:MAG: hypothetical protein AB1432_12010 [Bacteroidota bacterium]
MKRNEILAEEFYNTIFGEPWYGSSVKKILESANLNKSKKRVSTSIHSMEEILLHMCAWTEEVNNRLCGAEPKEPEIGDWPEPSDYKDLDWNGLVDKFLDDSMKIINSIKIFPESKLDNTVGTDRNLPLGTGITFNSMILGLIQHNVYHSAQISFIHKAMIKK